MTKLFFKLSTFALLLSTIIMTSCGEDIGIPTPGANGPTARLVAGADLISSDADLNADASFKVQLSATQGDSPMKSLSIFENGTRIPQSRLEINGSPAAANPILIVTDADKASFTYDITISGLPTGVNNYEFEVTDDAGEAGSTSVNVTGNSEPLAISLQQSGTYDGVEPGSLVTIPISIKGGATLNTISVTNNGVLVDANDLAFKEALTATTFTTNPLTLDAEDQGGFEGNIYIRATSGNNTYSISVTDAAGTTASTDVTINAGTALDGEFMAILVSNADGPDTGGLDLYNGISVPRSSDAAQVVDQGINTDLAVESNWLQEIAPVNGATLRKPSSDQPEGFKYENIDTEEAIIAAYDSAGSNLTSSGKLSEGDILLVEDGGNYFILQIMTVSVTSNDNKDFYEINVKQAIQ